MIVLYKGRRGSGKTLTMTKDGLQYLKDNYSILRNFNCKFGKFISDKQILSLNKDSNIKDCVLMIDEMQIFFDSRRSMKKTSIEFSNFIQQIRKRNIILLCTTQYSNTIDMRLRQHIDILALPHFIKSINVCEVVYIDATSSEDILENKQPRMVKMVYDAMPIFKLFDTSEMIR